MSPSATSPDLFAFLRDAFEKWRAVGSVKIGGADVALPASLVPPFEEVNDDSRGFCAFCRGYMAVNPVVATGYLNNAVCVHLSDGQSAIFFGPRQYISQVGADDGRLPPANAISITKHTGQNDPLPPAFEVPITGPR
jgi:hypothetical protein